MLPDTGGLPLLLVGAALISAGASYAYPDFEHPELRALIFG